MPRKRNPISSDEVTNLEAPKLAPLVYIGGSEPNLKATVISYNDDGTVTAELPDGSTIRRHLRNFL